MAVLSRRSGSALLLRRIFSKENVKSDWSGFHTDLRVNQVREVVHRHVLNELQGHLSGSRKERKKVALENSRHLLGELPTISKKTIGQFIDEVQEKCPTLSDRDLFVPSRS